MASSILLFANRAGKLATDPAGFLRTTWVAGTRTLADTQALMEQTLLALRRRSWSRILIDQTAMVPPLSEPEQAWLTTSWLPRAVRDGGYRHGAILLSPNALTRQATDFITTHVQGLPLTYCSFGTKAEALGWLLRQPATP